MTVICGSGAFGVIAAVKPTVNAAPRTAPAKPSVPEPQDARDCTRASLSASMCSTSIGVRCLVAPWLREVQPPIGARSCLEARAPRR